MSGDSGTLNHEGTKDTKERTAFLDRINRGYGIPNLMSPPLTSFWKNPAAFPMQPQIPQMDRAYEMHGSPFSNVLRTGSCMDKFRAFDVVCDVILRRFLAEESGAAF